MEGDVLFIVHDVYQEDNEFPLGVAYLASVLRNEGINVRIICADVYHYSDEQIGRMISSSHFDVIGVGFLAARFKETVLPLCKEIVKRKKDAWLVLGGHGPSPIPIYMLTETGADIVIIGEAEETLIEVVKRKVDRQPLAGIKGIVYKQGSSIVRNEKRKPIRNLDSVPFPAWDLFPMEKYASCMVYSAQERNEKSLQMITSRGCPFSCSFCARIQAGIRWRSIDNVIEEMKILRDKYGVTYFEFQDELFLFSKKRLFEFKDALDREKLEIKFYCQARVDIFDREIAECLKEIGCKKVNIGFESMNQKVLDGMNKRTTVKQNIETAEICHEFGLNMGLNFIWANSYDTEETLRENVDFIKKYNTYGEIRTIRPVTPYPGCPLYYQAIKDGLLKDSADFFDKFKSSDLLTVNFTDIPDDKLYELLFEANKKLIIDHFEKTNGDMNEAKVIIDDFKLHYFYGDLSFKGARHFDR